MRVPVYLKQIIIPLLLLSVVTACRKDEVEELKYYNLSKEYLDVAYGTDPLQKMDIYIPDGYHTATPVVFVIHGGGFIAGSKDEFTNVAKLFMSRGYVTVNLNHRLVDATGINQAPPAHILSDVRVVNQVEDIAAAVEKYKNVASEYGTGTAMMYMAGHSAGGTLSMLYVQGDKNKDGSVKASGNLAGLTNVTVPAEYYSHPPAHEFWPNVKELLYRMSGHEVVESNALSVMAISPNWVTVKNAPGKPNITLMPETNDDDLQFSPFFSTVNDAKDYHNELRKNKVSSEYILMKTDHGFGNNPDDWKTAVDHCIRFFQKIN